MSWTVMSAPFDRVSTVTAARIRFAPRSDDRPGGPRPPSPISGALRSLGGEPLPGVEADAGPVQHGVLDDREDELAVLLRAAHALRERGVLHQRRLELLGDAGGEAGREEARSDGEGPDAEAAEV